MELSLDVKILERSSRGVFACLLLDHFLTDSFSNERVKIMRKKTIDRIWVIYSRSTVIYLLSKFDQRMGDIVIQESVTQDLGSSFASIMIG